MDKVQAQGEKQRKVPVPRKFWLDFPINSFVKISLLSNPTIFYVDKVLAQGTKQRRIPIPQKFWKLFDIDDTVRVDIMKVSKKKK